MSKVTGYTVGSFDMFHIGHLNILKKAKKQCDYLIVGLNSDDTIRRCKGKNPIISYDERKAILESVRYVDKVIKVKCQKKDSKADDWKMRLDADIVFSGDDHKDSPEWRDLIEYKKNHGGKVVFFKYTKSTSSTLLRQVLASRV